MHVTIHKNKEIGGFFEFPFFDCFDPKKSVLHYLINSSGENNYIFVQDGRQAIKKVLQLINNVQERDCYLPAYLCHSILQPFIEMGLNIKFYSHAHPLIQIIDEKIQGSVILIIDYFGTEYFVEKKIRKFLDQGNTVIVDITHSIFDKARRSQSHENLFYIASLRKTIPIPDGAIIFHSQHFSDGDLDYSSNIMLMLDAMILKNLYTYENNEFLSVNASDLKKEFRFIYKKSEERKDEQINQINHIPLISLMIMSNLTFDILLKKRKQNLSTIYENIINDEILLYSYEKIRSPFMLPIYLKNNMKRKLLQKKLIKNDIYPPILWSIRGIVPKRFRYEHQLSNSMLSIPIDQRYSIEDMKKILIILNEDN